MFQSQRKDCSTLVQWVLSGQHKVSLSQYPEEINKLYILNYKKQVDSFFLLLLPN